jgi:hypothetical protein
MKLHLVAASLAMGRRATRPPPRKLDASHTAPRHEATLSATDARQGTTPGIVRWVLGISVPLAIVALIVVYMVVSR